MQMEFWYAFKWLRGLLGIKALTIGYYPPTFSFTHEQSGSSWSDMLCRSLKGHPSFYAYPGFIGISYGSSASNLKLDFIFEYQSSKLTVRVVEDFYFPELFFALKEKWTDFLPDFFTMSLLTLFRYYAFGTGDIFKLRGLEACGPVVYDSCIKLAFLPGSISISSALNKKLDKSRKRLLSDTWRLMLIKKTTPRFLCKKYIRVTVKDYMVIKKGIDPFELIFNSIPSLTVAEDPMPFDDPQCLEESSAFYMILNITFVGDSGKSRPLGKKKLSSPAIITTLVLDRCCFERTNAAVWLWSYARSTLDFSRVFKLDSIVLVTSRIYPLMTRPPLSFKGGACLRMELSQGRNSRSEPWSSFGLSNLSYCRDLLYVYVYVLTWQENQRIRQKRVRLCRRCSRKIYFIIDGEKFSYELKKVGIEIKETFQKIESAFNNALSPEHDEKSSSEDDEVFAPSREAYGDTPSSDDSKELVPSSGDGDALLIEDGEELVPSSGNNNASLVWDGEEPTSSPEDEE
ncbi:hypothetical protein GQ457_01G027960 [Hibiscus cannabinus]